jgi:hypothetical protein
MTLPASGLITLNDVNIELGRGSGAAISMNDSGLRTLFGQPSGTVDMNTGHGKSNASFTIGAGYYGGYPSFVGFAAWSGTGSCSPGSWAGYTIAVCYLMFDGANYTFRFTLNGNLAQNTWTSLTINGTTYYSASAGSCWYDGVSATSWDFYYQASNVISNGGTYPVLMT